MHLHSPQTEQDWPVHEPTSHITNTGKMIEEMEMKMRNLLQEARTFLPLRFSGPDHSTGVLRENT